MKEKLSPEKRLDQRAESVQAVTVRKVDGNARALTFVASTQDVARDGDIIETDGWQVASYLKNPVVLWMHDPYTPPIGKAISVTVGKTLDIAVEFDNDEFADRIFGLYERGFLNAVSVGFLPKAYRKPDDEERAELKLGPWGVVWTKTELLELSAVSVPADPGALVQNSIGPEDRAALSVMRGYAGIEDRVRFDRLMSAETETVEMIDGEIVERDDGPTIADLSDDMRDLTAAVAWLTDLQRAAGLAPDLCPDVPPESSLSAFELKLNDMLKED